MCVCVGGGGVGLGGGGGGGGQGGCERRIEVFVKIQKKNLGGGVGGWGGDGSGWGVALEGVRLDVKEELKFLGKFTKKNIFFLGGWGGGVRMGGQVRGRVGGGGQGSQKKNLGGGGVRVDVDRGAKFL